MRAWTSGEWVEHYGRNADVSDAIPWGHGHGHGQDEGLAMAEREAIAASMQGFQLGESSEGRHLVDRARLWSSEHDDPDYLQAIRLFIAEEGRHARDLGRFMDAEGIPRIRNAASDSAFRFLRRSAGLETSIAVLVTAEVVAQVYYAALREATASPVLRALCERILADEEAHVRFQAERLALLARGRGRVLTALRRATQRGLMLAALPVVWSVHRRAYRAGGYGFRRFSWETWQAFERALVLMSPGAYEWCVDLDESVSSSRGIHSCPRPDRGPQRPDKA